MKKKIKFDEKEFERLYREFVRDLKGKKLERIVNEFLNKVPTANKDKSFCKKDN